MKKLIIFCAFGAMSFTIHKATYYADVFQGRRTKSGEIFDQNKLTCASNIFKIGTRLKITNIKNERSVIVEVNDTGSFKKVSVDLSKKAFSKIADIKDGIIEIKIKKLCN